MTRTFIRPEGVQNSPAYSHAVLKRGRPVFIAGQVALDAQGNLVGPGDPRAQAEQVLRNLAAVVEACNGTLADIVKVTIYTTDLAHRPAIGEARSAVFPAGEAPASTFVVVSSLADSRFLVEIEAIALIRRGKKGRAAPELARQGRETVSRALSKGREIVHKRVKKRSSR